MTPVRFAQPSFTELFTPKLVTVLKEGYGLRDLRTDVVAGLTVAIVALPLSMAIAIASGATPDKGLITAIVGGLIISAFGGSRFQIGGPAGAFIPLVATTIAVHGYDGLVIATFMAGLMLVLVGLLRLGNYIKYIPYPVTVGFTAGIAVIIFTAQVRDLMGLTLAGREPPEVLHKLPVLWAALPTVNAAALALALLSIGLIVVVRRLRPAWPGFLIAVLLGSLAVALGQMPVETIGSRFGNLPSGLAFHGLPGLSLDRIRELIVPAVAIAMLGGIESLLSAVVADGMTGRRHRSNCELVAQGVANMASALFGGLPVTGTIARTATNVRAGARGPVSGVLHAVFLFAFLSFAGGLMAFVPLATLAAILAVVAWNMAEKREFLSLLRSSRGDALVLLAAFLLTVFVDLTAGIGVGIVLGALLFMHRMAEAIEIETDLPVIDRDVADSTHAQPAFDPAYSHDRDVLVYRLNGAFFFGAAGTVGAVFDRLGRMPKVFVLDMAGVPFLDTTGANTLDAFAHKLERAGTTMIISGANPSVAASLAHFGLSEPRIEMSETVATAMTLADARLADWQA
ncbi:SulP family inorganic anion transporter [Phreatobacter sp. AB_2022a]|uniref:SulP family inorganic anion transporter n=1 Tax=Phreatobacter sp. AB_2022a TaxID=3003134 RepID=UPI0022873DD2|nr:SulP family inorganic anion transporter [Phreatobacter sp. AB_2022a]MCZ0733573.1 SulP family inorganic anion transporter [Phreatobacter sp. AB_2022a]